ncbi:Jerky protein-like protein, partial [Stegodyphus mimosarum]
MTQGLMNGWFENHFIPKARQHLNLVGLPNDAKFALSVNNCSALMSVKALVKGNVSKLFFPANCTSVIQRVGIGIVCTLKCKYKVSFLKSMLNFLNNGKTVQEFKKYFSIKFVVRSIVIPWEDVFPRYFKKCLALFYGQLPYFIVR